MKSPLLPGKKVKLLIIGLILVQAQIGAQMSQTVTPAAQPYFPVTDSAPAFAGGLQAGYTITGESEKEVGKKGNFSRYKLKFYVTNTTNQPIMVTWGAPAQQTGPLLVRFTCLNATGARLTSKECAIQASPYNTEVWEDGRDAHGNAIRIKKIVNHGYGIGPGQTISIANNIIMIVPLDQRPEINATFSPAVGGVAGYPQSPGQPVAQTGYSAVTPPNGGGGSQNGGGGSQSSGGGSQNGGPAAQAGPSSVSLRNTSTGTYLNVPNGQIGCNGTDRNGWGCVWELLPVPGTKYYQIRNKVQQKFLSVENPGLLTDNSQSQAALWTIEQSLNAAGFRITNVMNNAVLVSQNGAVMIVSSNTQDNSAYWFVERD
jgi:hypothetical protein